MMIKNTILSITILSILILSTVTTSTAGVDQAGRGDIVPGEVILNSYSLQAQFIAVTNQPLQNMDGCMCYGPGNDCYRQNGYLNSFCTNNLKRRHFNILGGQQDNSNWWEAWYNRWNGAYNKNNTIRVIIANYNDQAAFDNIIENVSIPDGVYIAADTHNNKWWYRALYYDLEGEFHNDYHETSF